MALEGLDGRDAHGLGAREGGLQAPEVEARRVADVPDAVPVSEVGRDREGGADLGHQLEPLTRAPEVGRQEPQRRARERRRERAADEPHVVIERQPRHDAVFGREPGRLGHELDRRDDVSVGEHDPARVARAPRRVLEEGEVVLARGRRRGRRAVDVEVGRLEDRAHARRQRGTLVDPAPEPADGRDGGCLGVHEEARRPLHPERRIERDGHRADPQRAEERVEELGASRVDETDLVAHAHAGAREPRRVARALRPEAPVGHGLAVQVEVREVGRERGAPAHQLRQGRRGLHLVRGLRLCPHGPRHGSSPMAARRAWPRSCGQGRRAGRRPGRRRRAASSAARRGGRRSRPPRCRRGGR